MARNSIPDPLSRRHLLEGKLDAGKAVAIGRAYLEEGREVEAVDFLACGEATDELKALQTAAIERGDVFLLRVASGGLGVDPSPGDWERLGAAATAAGRVRDAESAARLATVR